MSFSLVEIARLISGGDEAVLRDVSDCAKDPAGWFAARQDQYMERGVTSAEDSDQIQWLGLAGILEEHGYVCERDWKDGLEDFLYFLRELLQKKGWELPVPTEKLDSGGDIPAWCAALDREWAALGKCVAGIDMESDSYVLFPCGTGELADLKQLAASIHHRIGPARDM